MADISRRIGLSKYTGEDEPVGTHEKHETGSDEKRSVEHSG